MVLWVFLSLSGLIRQDYDVDDTILELLFIIVSVVLISRVVLTTQNIAEFASAALAVGLIVLAASQVLRMGAGVNILTNITSSRILLVSLACAFFISMNSKSKYYYLSYVPLPVFGYEFISNSLKMNLITTSLIIVSCSIFYLIAGKYIRLLSFLAIFFAGAFFGMTLNADSNLKSRVLAFQKGAAVEGVTTSTSGTVGLEAKRKTAPFSLGKIIQVPEEIDPDLESYAYYDLAKEKCDAVSVNKYCYRRVLILFGRYKVLDVTERLRFWAHSIDLFEDNPLFGVGRGGYKIQLFYNGDGNPRVIEYYYPHNIMFEYLSMYGFVGYMLMTISLLMAGFVYLKATILDRRKFSFLMLYLVMLMASMMGGTLFDIRYVYVFAAMLLPVLGAGSDRKLGATPL